MIERPMHLFDALHAAAGGLEASLRYNRIKATAGCFERPAGDPRSVEDFRVEIEKQLRD